MFLPAGEGHPAVKASDLPTNEAGFVAMRRGLRGARACPASGPSATPPRSQGPDWRAKQGHLAEVMARVAASEHRGRRRRASPERESYLPHVGITCLLDMGNGAAYVHRDDATERMVPLPVVGHWLKKGWGAYFKLSKKRVVPRLPGM